MTAPPILSIIVVSWNVEDRLRDCLNSVAAGSLDLTREVIVVDNDSADGSADMVEAEFPDAVLIRNPDNRGFAVACNQGIEVARGRIILLLNPDTLVIDDVLAETVRYLDDHEDVGALGCQLLDVDGSVHDSCSRHPSLTNLALVTSGLARLPWPRVLGRYEYGGWDRRSERDVDVVTGCYMMMPRRVLDEVGVLDERFFFCGEETDLCLRIRRAGYKVRFAPVGAIVHEGNASGRQLRARRSVLLSRGLAQLHGKHGGALAAWTAWALLMAHNVSRAVIHGIFALLGRAESRSIAAHFLGVAQGLWTERDIATSRVSRPS